MLTLFAIPKAFRDEYTFIQRNAIESWLRLQPKPEILLFGDEEGTGTICGELGCRHEADVARNEFGTPLISDIIEKAQRTASNDLLCYVNADIMLLQDLMEAGRRVSQWGERFLMVGRRWDVDIAQVWDFAQPEWEQRLRSLVSARGRQHEAYAIDYFVFPRQLTWALPPFAVGRPGWDNWMLWRARSSKIPVVDASQQVMAVHQNHSYRFYPGGHEEILKGPEGKKNRELMGGWLHDYSIDQATHRLTAAGVRVNLSKERWLRRLEMLRRWCLEQTRPLRQRLGLQRGAFPKVEK